MLGSSWAILEACWGYVAVMLGHVGAMLSYVEAMLGPSCGRLVCWRHVGGMLRPCCVLEMLAPGQGPKRDFFCHFPLPCEDG